MKTKTKIKTQTKTKAKMRVKMKCFCVFINFTWPRGAVDGKLSLTFFFSYFI